MRIQRTVALRVGGDGLRPLARFQLEGNALISEWLNDGYRQAVERDGIRLEIEGPLQVARPAEGRRFFEALELTYRSSSRIVVVDEPIG